MGNRGEDGLLRVAVIGGGIAGLTCARLLAARGCAVRVLDKGRRPGGRVSTRRTDGHAYDHGAQYFTARDARFRGLVKMLRREGAVANWRGRFVNIVNGDLRQAPVDDNERFVGVPGMSTLAAWLATDVPVMTGVQVARIEHDRNRWTVIAADGVRCDNFDVVIVAVPAPQAEPLIKTAPALADAAAAVRMESCWTAMIALERPMPVGFDAAMVTGGALSWIARDGAKPGRTGAETWVLHASDQWSRAHLDDNHASVAEALLVAFADATNVILTGVEELQAHRWRYARVVKAVGQPCLFDEERRIGACGDWCLGARIEAAFLSGTAMAEQVLASLLPVCRSGAAVSTALSPSGRHPA